MRVLLHALIYTFIFIAGALSASLFWAFVYQRADEIALNEKKDSVS